MKKLGSKIFTGCLFILILVCVNLSALPALAASGISVGPTDINITDAMRGSRYDKQVSVFNGGDDPTEYKISVEGDVADWIYPSYEGEALTSLTIPASSRENFDVTITIPSDAANGDYTAKVTVTSVASASGPGQAVALEAYSNININVSGTQNIAGTVNGITVKDQESGFPVLFQVHFRNSGNVMISPLIDITINWEGTEVDSFIYQDSTFQPEQQDYIDVTWDTTSRTPGNYSAAITVYLEEEEIYNQDLNFKILTLGSLTRSGELLDLNIEGTMKPGKIAKINALFVNSGEADVLARLAGEIYLDDELLDMLQGDEIMVNRGTQRNLSVYFTPEQEGTYTFKGQIDFGGKQTEIKEITFAIAADAVPIQQTITTTTQATSAGIEENNEASSSNPWPIVGGVIGGLIIIGIGIILWRKR